MGSANCIPDQIRDIEDKFKDVLSDANIPSTPEGCSSAIKNFQERLKSQLINSTGEQKTEDYDEVDRKKLGEKEIGRRIISSYTSGNQTHTTWEITIEENYQITKKLNEQAKAAQMLKAFQMFQQAKDFQIKCERKLFALQALKELYKKLEESMHDSDSQTEESDPVMTFIDVASLLIQFFPYYRYLKFAKLGINFTKMIFRAGKLEKENYIPLPPPQNKYQVFSARSQNPKANDRTVPANLSEQIAQGALKTAEKGEIKVMARGQEIRDKPRLDNVWGPGQWEKCEFSLKNYGVKTDRVTGAPVKPKSDVVIHFYKDEARKLIVEPKFKNSIVTPKPDPLANLFSVKK